jgi:hypothetical protein
MKYSNADSIKTVKVICTNNNKTIDAELFDVKPNKITVILPGFQKLTLNKSLDKPNLYTANQFGMEFYANYTA